MGNRVQQDNVLPIILYSGCSRKGVEDGSESETNYFFLAMVAAYIFAAGFGGVPK